MLSSVDFNLEYLTLSTHEAIACQSLPVAISSLSVLLNLYSPGKEMPMPEVTVLWNLITLLHQSSDPEHEILKYTKRARTKMTRLGVESFFGEGAIGSHELSWFAGNSWNLGLKLGKEKKYGFCADFLELAPEFYSEIGDESDETRFMSCKALIVSVGAMINAEEQKKAPMSESDVKKAMEMLGRAGKLLPSISRTDRESSASDLFFLHTFNTYHLLNRLDNPHPQQLHLLKTFIASKFSTPQHLLQLTLLSSQTPNPNPEATSFALNTCLSSLLASPTPGYQTIAVVLRKLARLDFKNDGGFGVYRQAYQIIVGLKEGEYPSEEGKWLATTAWNKGRMAIRVRQAEVVKRWMKMGLDLARRVKGMEESLANFEKICDGGCGGGDRGGSLSRTEVVSSLKVLQVFLPN